MCSKFNNRNLNENDQNLREILELLVEIKNFCLCR